MLVDEWIKYLICATGLLYLAAVIGALGGKAKGRRFYFWSNLGSFGAAICLIITACLALFGKTRFHWLIDGPIGWLRFLLQLDAVSGYFLLIFGILAALVSIYAMGYHQINRAVAVFQPLFLASLTGLLCAYDVVSFLLFWELMSITSYFLIVAGGGAEAKRSGFIYLIMTQLGTAFVFVATLGLAAASGVTLFTGISAKGIDSASGAWLLVALVIGFGAKAGVVPLHIWLPRAHPAAPAPVSALLSGFMIKAAIYGLIRYAGFFRVDWWFGTLLFVVGLVTALLGILYALMESDYKRLLAYCSIENIGILFVLAGAYFWGRAAESSLLTGLGLAALLFHVANHALFKGLLFMSAGAVSHGSGTVAIEQLGGLIKKMPQTACFTLIGCMAGAGLPITGGFISEWLILQTLFTTGIALESAWLKILVFLGIAVIALTAGLAGATFVKLFGVGFLALPRSPHSKNAQEVGPAMRLAMGLAAAGCLVLGLFPWLGMQALLPGIGAPDLLTPQPGFGLGLFQHFNTPLLVWVTIGVITAIPWLLCRKRLGARVGTTWNCGVALRPPMEYSGASFAKMARRVFGFLLQPKRRLTRPQMKHPLFPGPLEYHSELPGHFEERLYRPGQELLLKVSAKVRKLQTGSIKLYLGYILAVLLLLLVYLRWSF